MPAAKRVSDAPLDEVESKTLFEWEDVALFEHKRADEAGDEADEQVGEDLKVRAPAEAEWVDIGRGILRVCQQLVKGFRPDTTLDPATGMWMGRSSCAE